MRPFRLFLFALILVIIGLCAKAWQDTTADPIVRRATITLPGLEPGTKPVTVLLMSDIHVAGPDMPPSRLERIVKQANALEPDIVAIAGDFVSDKRIATHRYPTEEVIAPLAKLEARIARVAVPGNHDHWRDAAAVEEELRKAGFTVLLNEALQAGPVAIGGLDDEYTRHADMTRTLAAFEGLSGPRLLLTHSPGYNERFPAEIDLVLAGHTHCGQIRYPWGGTPAGQIGYGGHEYACGMQRLQGTLRVTAAGIGTSVLPIRFLAVPDMWLITIRPPERQAPTAASQ